MYRSFLLIIRNILLNKVVFIQHSLVVLSAPTITFTINCNFYVLLAWNKRPSSQTFPFIVGIRRIYKVLGSKYSYCIGFEHNGCSDLFFIRAFQACQSNNNHFAK